MNGGSRGAGLSWSRLLPFVMMSALMLVEGSAAQPSMSGYDCGTPVQTIITRKDSQCTLYRDKPEVTPSILIQKEIELTLQGFKCSMVHTRHVCTTARLKPCSVNSISFWMRMDCVTFGLSRYMVHCESFRVMMV